MKLTRDQSQKLLSERVIWIAEACDKCGKLLGSVRWTCRGEPGEWCSAQCRDGVEAAPQKAKQRACRQCGISLQGKRGASEFFSDGHRKRFAKSSASQNRRLIAETPIGNQRLTDAQNSESMNTLAGRFRLSK